MVDSTSKRGLASASKQTRTRVAKMGAQAQPIAAKRKGGHNSRSGGGNNSS